MSVFDGNKKIKKIFLGNVKIKSAYLGADKVWSGASVVTYNVDVGTTYTEEIEEGSSALTPSSFTPTKSGWTFLGWKESGIASSDVLVTKIADGNPITLYAVFYNPITLTKYNASNTPSYAYGTRYYNNNDVLNPSFTLTENALSGWNKAGWTTNASGYSATVADGGTITLTANATYYSLFTQQLSCSVHCSTRSAWGGWITDYGNRVANIHNTTGIQNPTFGPYTEADLNGPIGMTGWVGRGFTTATSGGASGVTVSNGGSITTESSLTLYAMYYRTVTLSYYGNGNTGGSTSATTGTAYYHTASGVTNASVYVSGNGFTKSNYTFIRWRLNSASGTIYTAGTYYTSYVDATMYAEWEATSAAFGYTGGVQTYVAKAGKTYQIQCYGAVGGSGDNVAGAYGAYAIGYRTPSTDETWYIYVGGAGGASNSSNGTVGGGGYNGGGAGGAQKLYDNYRHASGGGGGASSVSTTNAGASGANIIVAGGGGAGGHYMQSYPADGPGSSTASSNGVRGQGTNAVVSASAGLSWCACAGGGGYYGGASGGNVNDTKVGGYSGTNYTGGTSSAGTSQGQNSGNGAVYINIV